MENRDQPNITSLDPLLVGLCPSLLSIDAGPTMPASTAMHAIWIFFRFGSRCRFPGHHQPIRMGHRLPMTAEQTCGASTASTCWPNRSIDVEKADREEYPFFMCRYTVLSLLTTENDVFKLDGVPCHSGLLPGSSPLNPGKKQLGSQTFI